MKGALACLLLSIHAFAMASALTCDPVTLDFIVQDGNALLASIEDNVRADLAKVNINVVTRLIDKDNFNSNMTSGNFHLCFSETWGPPYDPHSYASSWKAPDEAHYAALQGMQAPLTQAQLTTDITNVLLEGNVQTRTTSWKNILTGLHSQAIDLPFSGKRMPTVLRKRLAGYQAGQQQYDYPVHQLQVLSGSTTITVAPGAQSGLFSTVGRLDPHTYRPNEFFIHNWVYEGLVSYGADGVIEPSLAASWTITDLVGGGQQYKFTLRDGVTFQDGESWNCTVAKLNFDHVLAPPLTTSDEHGWYDLPKQITSWSCQGPGTGAGNEFVVNTQDKYYPLLQELTYIRPLRMLSPAKFAHGITTSAVTNNTCCCNRDATGNGQTIRCTGITSNVAAGTGPFSYVETRTNGDAHFTRHTAHWRSVPQIENILVKKYATAAAVMAALLDGSLDAVMGAGVLEPMDFNTIRTQHVATFDTFLGPPIMNRVIIINSNKAPTNDLTLRKVIMHAVDKATIIDSELYGMAEPVDALFPKNAPYCGVDLTPRWDYDFEKAQLLRCPTQAQTQTTVMTADEDGVNVAVVIIIVCAVVVLASIAALAMFIYGKKQGALYEKMLQTQKKGGAQDDSDVMGKSAEEPPAENI